MQGRKLYDAYPYELVDYQKAEMQVYMNGPGKTEIKPVLATVGAQMSQWTAALAFAGLYMAKPRRTSAG